MGGPIQRLKCEACGVSVTRKSSLLRHRVPPVYCKLWILLGHSLSFKASMFTFFSPWLLPCPTLLPQKGRSDSGVSVSSSRGVTSRARSTSIDSPGLSGPGRAGVCESGPSAASLKLEGAESSRKLVGHPTVKRRARGRKLSSSSEGSEGSEVPPSLISKGTGDKETTKTPVDQCLTIAEEPSPLPHESSDTVLSLDEVTQDSLVAASATAEETTMDTDVAQLSAKAPSPRAGDTEDKSSSDSSSDDSSSSDSEASDAVDRVQLPAKEDMDHTSQMEAKTEPFSPSLSSVASPVNKTAQGWCWCWVLAGVAIQSLTHHAPSSLPHRSLLFVFVYLPPSLPSIPPLPLPFPSLFTPLPLLFLSSAR